MWNSASVCFACACPGASTSGWVEISCSHCKSSSPQTERWLLTQRHSGQRSFFTFLCIWQMLFFQCPFELHRTHCYCSALSVDPLRKLGFCFLYPHVITIHIIQTFLIHTHSTFSPDERWGGQETQSSSRTAGGRDEKANRGATKRNTGKGSAMG